MQVGGGDTLARQRTPGAELFGQACGAQPQRSQLQRLARQRPVPRLLAADEYEPGQLRHPAQHQALHSDLILAQLTPIWQP